MKSTRILAFLLATLLPLHGIEHPLKIFFGDEKHPVMSGEAWLITNRWGAYQAVLVGTIRKGRFEERKNIEFPQYWEQAFDYKLLLAISENAVEAPVSFETDAAYGWAAQWPEYLKHFRTVYLSTPLAKENRGEDWHTALRSLGHFVDGKLVLPRPSTRTIRFIYPDGKPLAGERLVVSLFGIPLGEFVTNASGEINVIAPDSQLGVSVGYFEEVAGGPTGTAFASFNDLVVNKGHEVTVRRLWTLPEHDYMLQLHTPENQPIAAAYLDGCEFQPPCMGSCGPLRAPEADRSGTIRFRERDLRELRSITIVDAQGRKRDLTDSEMRELLTTYQLGVAWK
ncbi:MAG TPA: hypothetical protein VEG30_12695 [Terriglobales bacterium]|nr:hypothetical protein [Terriglobales bacterium]